MGIFHVTCTLRHAGDGHRVSFSPLLAYFPQLQQTAVLGLEDFQFHHALLFIGLL
jgi:hypothetical protein